MAGRRPELTVHGGGIFGLSVAWTCLRAGAAVRVVDRARIGAGSSGGLVGALAPHVPENWNPKKAFQLDSLLMAERFWAGVAAAGGVDPGYARTGRWQPLADAAARDLAQARAAGAGALWRGQAVWRVIPAPPGDWTPRSATGLLVEDTLSARLSPRAAGAALAAAIRAGGGQVEEGIEAKDGPGLHLWATGAAGLADLARDLGRTVGTGIKGQAALMRPVLPVADLPQLFVEGLHIVPHADGTVAIGSTTEREFAAPDTTDDQLDALIAAARAACPALADAPVIDRWAGLRPRARSRAPMLGPWPGRPGHFIANGGFKIGFGMAPKVAEVMAALMLEGRDAIPAGFRVEDSL
ncbi:NAD(P)/FAD-dependent oxidoreductase [Frigidibacter oleivorans]|uniref:NAD(P)/FAD-dependent oxidoreductase n=1 Tax=Frigidibacter oleivorans TaxID=2487129 RepID=UPI000F8DEED5|nr:FAD-binding oxidoreductase [Frigidibacter oleivorans]